MARLVVPAALALAAALSAQSSFFPLKDLKPGMRGTGRTVFSGNKIEEFQVEILGVLDNIGPKESLIIGRLSGGPLEHTGVMQGMSGSPVYIDGKLVGAVAMAFPFAKDPVAGIRPIEAMVRSANAVAPLPNSVPAQRAALVPGERDLTRFFSRPVAVSTGDARLVDIATPISFGGFSRATLDAFTPQLRALGLEPRQGVTSGGKLEPGMGNPADIRPGSMISVALMAGDLTVGADGTVTYVDGARVYAFGHRFLDIGSTALPFARAEVLTLLANTNTSFKISSAREWMGTINQDRNTAIAGELGRKAPMVPLAIQVSRRGRTLDSYQMQMVNDDLLSPLLLQMAVYSAIDETERTVGASTIRITGEVEFQNAPTPLRVNNLYASDNGSAMQVSLSAAVPVAFAMQSGFDGLKLKKVTLNLESFDEKKEVAIDGITTSRREVHPGEKVQLHINLAGDNGLEIERTVEYQVPIGAEPGTLFFTVADAATANIADFRQVLAATPRNAGQVLSTVNSLHPNTRAYVRVWRADPAFQLEGVDLPDPPASVALILAGQQTSSGGITQTRNSKVAAFEVDAGDLVVTGSKTVQVEIKE
ncbi:MAG TPA: SpoIVB peptidase S55 domain-containing protein [Candidatus Acidoferrales bacterium]|nr:SpoIVB peptidase S55 domain-containing protein [Candidatus Acidoferrales bacterium]